MNTLDLTASSSTPVVVVTDTPYRAIPSTEAQLEIWLASQQSHDANCAYNEISSIEFRGPLNTKALQQAALRVVQRHESLRSTFSKDGRSVLIHEQAEFDFETLDWSKESSADQDARYSEFLRDQGTTAFDLVKGPLIRFVLQMLGADHCRLTMNAHHLVMDGWSLGVFCHDLAQSYAEICGTSTSEGTQATQYSEYAAAMHAYETSKAYKADEAFWQDQFQDSLPVLDTPIEYARPPLKTYNSQRYDHHLGESLVEGLRHVGARHGCSLFNTVLAAFTAYLGRLTDSTDVCIGIPTAGQAALDQQEVVGFCVNTMPFRTQIDDQHSFAELLRRNRSKLLDAFEHQQLSFGKLLRLLSPPRDPSRSPIIDVTFNLDPAIDLSDSGFDDIDVEVKVEPRCFEKFEWFINGVIHRDQSVELQIQFNTDLYSEDAIRFYFDGFEAFLAQIVADETKAVAEYHLMSIPQRMRVIVDWNQTESEDPSHSTLHEAFRRQATATPERIAVEYEGRKLTYQALEAKSNQVARFLQSQGVRSGDLVGICVERSEQMLVDLIAILKAGAGYVPLDPAYPSDRLKYMCDHSQLKWIVTRESLRVRAAEFGKPLLILDRSESEISRLPIDPPSIEVGSSDLCYVIYTSGSTGKPKGVQVPHGAVVNFLHSMKREPGFGSDDSILAVTTLSFDIAVLELFLPLIAGGNVVMLDSKSAAIGERLAEQIQEHDISMLQATPSTWRLLVQSGWSGKSDLKVLCGGEPMPPDLVAPLLERSCQLWNLYGPTETTVWSAAYQITDATAPILIGRPIGNTQIYLLDSKGREVPPGCEGELFIGGAGVTLGYRNRPDLTHQRFLENPYRNPHANYISDRLYRTGDIARYRMDGNLEFLRRNDKQVKVRGYRIELGEIEQNLKQHPDVQQTVVIVREDSPNDAKLVAYWISSAQAGTTPTELRSHLRETLPAYMVPQHFVQLKHMPQTANGKIDYKQLPKPTDHVTDDSDNTAGSAMTAEESYVLKLCCEVLEHQDVSLDDTFFDAGGHSLLVMQLIARIEQDADISLGPQEFLVKTLRQLASKLDLSEIAEEESSDSVLEMSDASEPILDRESGRVSESKAPYETGAVERDGYLSKLQRFWD
ncbi:MAG: amino acid adenylation domain-containing protein [Planctomycetota bacterium]